MFWVKKEAKRYQSTFTTVITMKERIIEVPPNTTLPFYLKVKDYHVSQRQITCRKKKRLA